MVLVVLWVCQVVFVKYGGWLSQMKSGHQLFGLSGYSVIGFCSSVTWVGGYLLFSGDPMLVCTGRVFWSSMVASLAFLVDHHHFLLVDMFILSVLFSSAAMPVELLLIVYCAACAHNFRWSGSIIRVWFVQR